MTWHETARTKVAHICLASPHLFLSPSALHTQEDKLVLIGLLPIPFSPNTVWRKYCRVANLCVTIFLRLIVFLRLQRQRLTFYSLNAEKFHVRFLLLNIIDENIFKGTISQSTIGCMNWIYIHAKCLVPVHVCLVPAHNSHVLDIISFKVTSAWFLYMYAWFQYMTHLLGTIDLFKVTGAWFLYVYAWFLYMTHWSLLYVLGTILKLWFF